MRQRTERVTAKEMVGLRKVLIVEDSARLRRALRSALLARSSEMQITDCATAQSARDALARETPDLLLLDVHLPDGSAFEVLDAARPLRPTPITIAMSGKASADEAFRLARLGVSIYLPKPLDLTTLNTTLEQALAEPPDLEVHVRSAVGKIAVKDAERLVRSTMVDEALARSAGNLRGAARLLNVSRELLQHILRSRRSEG